MKVKKLWQRHAEQTRFTPAGQARAVRRAAEARRKPEPEQMSEAQRQQELANYEKYLELKSRGVYGRKL